MQAPNLDPAVLNHFLFLLEGIQRLERKTQADLWKPTVPLDSGTRLFWAQWPGTDKPSSIKAHSVNIQQARLLMG